MSSLTSLKKRTKANAAETNAKPQGSNAKPQGSNAKLPKSQSTNVTMQQQVKNSQVKSNSTQVKPQQQNSTTHTANSTHGSQVKKDFNPDERNKVYQKAQTQCKIDVAAGKKCLVHEDCQEFKYGSNDWPLDKWRLEAEQLEAVNKDNKDNYRNGKNCIIQSLWKEGTPYAEELKACGGTKPVDRSQPNATTNATRANAFAAAGGSSKTKAKSAATKTKPKSATNKTKPATKKS